MKKLKIFYTSDVHGYLFPTDYLDKTKKPLGLLQAGFQFKKDDNTLVIDGGDIFQGSPMINKLQREGRLDNGIATVMNAVGYDYLTLGNHDFNYGFDQLKENLAQLNAKITAVNILDKKTKQQLYPAQIKVLANGLRIGLIGAVTDYVNVWEKPDHISDIEIVPVFAAMKAELERMRPQVDFTIGIYHGGFERDLVTGKVLSESGENVGYQLATELDFDLLLTGHQHGLIPGQYLGGTYILQLPNMAQRYAKVSVEITDDGNSKIESELCFPQMKYDETLARQILPVHEEIEKWLDMPVIEIAEAIPFKSHLDLALNCNAIIETTAKVQQEATDADIIVVGMNNNRIEFPKSVSIRNVMQVYPFDNTLFKLKVTGKILREAIEKTAEYFVLNDQHEIIVNPEWLRPKKEHYNYDFYFGVHYVIDVSRPFGSRVTELTYKGAEVKDEDGFTLALNNYRAAGGGEYKGYKEAEVITDTGLEIQDLLIKYFENGKKIISGTSDFKVKNKEFL